MEADAVSATGAPTMIGVRHLSKTFSTARGDVVALDDINLEIPAGAFVVMLGPSGCGKSTLLNIMAGLDQPTAGEVVVDQRRAGDRGGVGIMFQKSLLFPWRTVLANLLLPAELARTNRSEARDRAEHLLEVVGLGEWGRRYPWELSGGMQQRVALARVLMTDPAVLLLDEPFGALDEMTREALDLELMAIATSKTVVLVTHNVYEAVLMADVVYTLTPRPGRLSGVVEVDLPRPRELSVSGTPAFAAKVAEARRLLRGDSR